MPPISQILQFIENHWALSLGLVAVLGFLIFEEFKKQFTSSRNLSPQEVIKLINHENAVVVDMREHNIFRDAHIIDSINVVKTDIEKGAQKLAGYKEKPLVLVAVVGQEAQKVAGQLKSQGFNKVYVLSNGITAWKGAGLPLVKK